MSWLRSLLRYATRAKLVGTDLAGNQYFEKAGQAGYKPRRSVKVKDVKYIDEYTQDTVPPEWDRWLRGLQKDPPTIDEMTARVQQAQVMQQKVLDVEDKDKLLREKEIAEGLVASSGTTGTKATGHASAPSFTAPAATGDEATSTGDEFQPASWKPPPK